jgi:hypothetical protein
MLWEVLKILSLYTHTFSAPFKLAGIRPQKFFLKNLCFPFTFIRYQVPLTGVRVGMWRAVDFKNLLLPYSTRKQFWRVCETNIYRMRRSDNRSGRTIRVVSEGFSNCPYCRRFSRDSVRDVYWEENCLHTVCQSIREILGCHVGAT